ncbi:MFS hexose transporter [Apiospora rasikravindrae]|uniref:MFS hexose transporter n=1 Tax=Apiospora rasikravindrae TaxID=990691 RepID=A0ABR1TED4_9PEZI
MVAIATPHVGAKGQASQKLVMAQEEAPEFERVHWLKEPHLRKLYACCFILMLASATTGYDGSLINVSQQIPLWKKYLPEVDEEADQNSESWLGLLVNMMNIGSIVSFFITPYVADNYGRRLAIAIGCVFMVLGGCLSAFANGYGMFIAGRFLLGFGNSFAQMASPLLLTEICHPQHRGPLTAVYNCLWNAGSLIVSCIGWGTATVNNDWSWRSITFIQVVPSVVQLAFIYWIPESPRFLLHKDRSDEALHMLAKYHAGGDVNNATVQFEFREIRETMRLEKEANRNVGYADFLKTKGNRWRLAILISLGIISQYSGNALFSNYINAVYKGAGITGVNQQLGLSTGKTILDLIVTIGAAMTVDYFGRRPLFLLSAGGMCASFLVWTIIGAIYENSGETNMSAGYAQIPFVWFFGIFYDIGFSGLLIAYALEILPFKLRAKGMTIMNIVVQAVLAIGNQTNLLAWNRLPSHWNFMLFYTLWDFVEFVFVYFFYVETKGPTLEEIAKIFDGTDAVVADVNLHQVEKDIHTQVHEEEILEKDMNSPKSAI